MKFLTAVFHHSYSADQLFVICTVVQHVTVVNEPVLSCHYYRLRLCHSTYCITPQSCTVLLKDATLQIASATSLMLLKLYHT